MKSAEDIRDEAGKWKDEEEERRDEENRWLNELQRPELELEGSTPHRREVTW